MTHTDLHNWPCAKFISSYCGTFTWSYMDRQSQANYQWRIQGRTPPPLFLDQIEARKAETIFFWQVTHIRNHRRRLGTRLVKIQISSQVSLGWTKRQYLTISEWTNCQVKFSGWTKNSSSTVLTWPNLGAENHSKKKINPFFCTFKNHLSSFAYPFRFFLMAFLSKMLLFWRAPAFCFEFWFELLLGIGFL